MAVTMQMITEMNNGGADHLDSGDIDTAFKNFRCALELLRRMNEQRNDVPSSQAPEGLISSLATDVDARPMDTSLPSPEKSVESLQQVPPQPKKPAYRHAHYVYREAMELNPALNEVFVENWDAYQALLFAIIQFNLGLALQMKSKDAGERALVRALAWYDACLETVQNAAGSAAPLQLDLILATLNNMAIISYDLCRFSKVRQIYQSVLDILSTYSKTNHQSHGLFADDEMEDLLMNIMLLHKAVIAPAA